MRLTEALWPASGRPSPPLPSQLAWLAPLLVVQVNAGQANAATGSQGYQDCLASADAVAKVLGVQPGEVLLESTGVIGRRIKMEVRTGGRGGGASSQARDLGQGRGGERMG